MTDRELLIYIKTGFKKEGEAVDWKGWKNLPSTISGSEGDDIVSYISAISNMEGGHLIIGVVDDLSTVCGIKNFGKFNTENIKFDLTSRCSNLPSEGLYVREYVTEEGNIVWMINIPKHMPRLPVYAHGKAWQRIGDSLTPMNSSRQDSNESPRSKLTGYQGSIRRLHQTA